MEYPNSRSFEEFQQIDPMKSDYYFHKYDEFICNNDISSIKQPLEYSEAVFRTLTYPVLWLDSIGDVHWNEAAEREMYKYLLEKQFSTVTSEDYCQSHQLIILNQWIYGGFFSRFHCLIDQFGQSLYSPSMALLSPQRFLISNAGVDDYLIEGILGYLAPMSFCSGYMHHKNMTNIDHEIRRLTSSKKINTFEQLRSNTDKFLFLAEVWKFGIEHIPHRHWLFDFDHAQAKHSLLYNASIGQLTNHSYEHIYHSSHLTFDLNIWKPRNHPHHAYSDHLTSDSMYKLTWKDQSFMSFLHYMFTLYFYKLPPRIELITKLLKQ
ncbi:unnamed protein product, partial [Didymodactylos carnosus]